MNWKKMGVLMLATILMGTNEVKASGTIAEVISDYFEGYQKAEVSLIQKAFHSSTKLLSVDEGKLDSTEMNDWLKNLEDRKIRGDIRQGQLEILAIDQTDYAATAKLQIKFPKAIFTDYLSILKIDGDWKIVGKIYHYQEVK